MELNKTSQGSNVPGDDGSKLSFTSRIKALISFIYQYIKENLLSCYLYLIDRNRWEERKLRSTLSEDSKIYRLACLKNLRDCLQNQDGLNESQLSKFVDFQRDKHRELYKNLGMEIEKTSRTSKHDKLKKIVLLENSKIPEDDPRTEKIDKEREMFNKSFKTFKSKVDKFFVLQIKKTWIKNQRVASKDFEEQKTLREQLQVLESSLNTLNNEVKKIYDLHIEKEYSNFLQSFPEDYLLYKKDEEFVNNVAYMLLLDTINLDNMCRGKDYINIAATSVRIPYDADILAWIYSYDLEELPQILIEEKRKETEREIIAIENSMVLDNKTK